MGYFLIMNSSDPFAHPATLHALVPPTPPLGGTGADKTRHRRKRKRGEKKDKETGGSDSNSKKLESKTPLHYSFLIVSVLICLQVNSHVSLLIHQSRDSSAGRASD